jgi:membrane protein
MSKFIDSIKNHGSMFKTTFKQWNQREPFNNSIIIAYYTIFSLPGLLVILINIAGYFFGAEAVTKQLSGQIGGLVGGDTAKSIQDMIANAQKMGGTTLSTILSVATLLFGATGVFYQLQQMLNKIWEVKPKPKESAILKLIKDRVFSFGLILVVGFLLLVSLVLSAALSALSGWVESHVSEAFLVVFNLLDILVSIGVVTVLFAAIFKFLPDAKIVWRDVWHGAIMTSILFVIAKYLLGLYFGNSDPGSTYGAAGSIILIMLWVSYAGLILLFGAEFTQVYARAHGRNVKPTEGAVSTEGKNENGAIVNKKTEVQTKKAAGGVNRKPEPRASRQSDVQPNVNGVSTGKNLPAGARIKARQAGKPKISFGEFLAGYIIHKIRR